MPARAGQPLRELLLGQLLRTVAGEHVADLVPEDAGQLPFGFEQLVEPAGDEDLPARQGEGVHGFGVVEQMKLERIGVFASLLAQVFIQGRQQSLANVVNGLACLWAGAQAAVLGLHLGGGFAAPWQFPDLRSCRRADARR